MYTDFGHGVFLREQEIIGVFDLDNTTVAKSTRDFLSKAEKEGRVVSASDDIPNSFILTDDKVYFVRSSIGTLRKRVKS